MKKYWVIGTVILLVSLTACNFLGPCFQGYGPVVMENRELDDFTGVSNTDFFDVVVSCADSFSVEVEAQENLVDFIETYVSGSTLVVKTKNSTCISSPVPVTVYITLPELEEISNTGSGSLTADSSDSDNFEISNTGSGVISIAFVSGLKATMRNTGSGKVYMDEADVSELNITHTGSGITDAGIIDQPSTVNINHTSSGQVFANLLEANSVDARLTGSGKILLEGEAVSADYSLSSSGKIDALDLPVADAKITISGSGKVYASVTDFMDVIITSSGGILYLGNPEINSRITGSGSIRKYSN